MTTPRLPPEYLEEIRHIGLGYLPDAFSSLDERLNGIAATFKRTNDLLAAILAAQGGTPPPSNGGQPPTIDGRLDLLVDYVNKIPVFWGTASNATANTLVHNGQVWENDVWAGYLLSIVGGKGAGQTRSVVANSREALTIREAWSQVPDATSVYVLRLSKSTVANLDFIATGQKTVTTAGTAERLSMDQEVPAGFAVTIMGKPANVGSIYVARSKTIAEDASATSQRFDALEADLAVSLKVSNLNCIWINSSVNGEGVSWIVESVE